MRTRLPTVLVLSIVTALACGAARGEEEEPPRDLGIVEKTERRLIQFDVTVLGPAGRVAALTAEDFRVKVSGREIEGILVDRLCSGEPRPATKLGAGSIRVDATAPPVRPPGTSYLFYFDQHHLTMSGRDRSLELARELVERLIGGSNRAMIVSSGRELRTFSGFSSDREELYAALERLRADTRQQDTFATEEDARVEQVFDELGFGLDVSTAHARVAAGDDLSRESKDVLREMLDGRQSRFVDMRSEAVKERQRELMSAGVKHAKLTALSFQREEKWHTERALSRFAQVLGRLTDVNPPKAVIYFADRMRSNAGDHYVALFSDVKREAAGDALDPASQVLIGANLPIYDQVIDEAAAHGVRLYTVQAEGLTDGVASGVSSSASAAYLSLGAASVTRRFTDAQNGLAGWALETGGQVFLNGVGPTKIARRIEADLGCVYLISFDAGELPEDRALSLKVLVDDPKLEARTRTRLYVPSESARLVTRLTNAFGGAGQLPPQDRLRTVVIPTGFSQGKYSTLVQVQLPGAEGTGPTWDVGVSVLSRGRPGRQASSRIAVPAPGLPVVFEAEMEFSPGPFEVTAVAHEVTGDLIVSGQAEGEWPDPGDDEATVGPIALLQPAEALFVRGAEHRSTGPLARTEEQFVLPDRPTALVAVVCRERPRKLALELERQLEGETAVDFPPLAVEAGEERCFLLSDLVPGGVMTEGAFLYSVRVMGEEGQLAAARREFAAVLPTEELPAAEPPPR